jgi:hypothetical protein
MKIHKYLCIGIAFSFIIGAVGVTSKNVSLKPIRSEDFDPLVDVQVTVEIQKIRALDKNDVQVHKESYIDKDANPNLYVKIFINDQEFTSPIWSDTKYIYTPGFSATVNVPDDQEFVAVKIQLWDTHTGGDVLCDIGNATDDATMTYSIKTGRWTGDDQRGDPSGYGRLNGCDDKSIYGGRGDAELWFNIYQNDYDGDGAPYWVEVNEYGTNPEVNNSLDDSDNDRVPFSWEWSWDYNPVVAEIHQTLDPDVDSLSNVEEYMTSQWGSDPFRKDMFLELDQMSDSPSGQTGVFPVGSKEILYTAYNRQNILYHLDDGSWQGSGADMIPFDNSTDYNELDSIYTQYFLHGDQNNWRRGVFHYGVVVFQDEDVNGCAFGANRFQISSNGMEQKVKNPLLDRDTIYASAYMHETGHSLGFWPIPGHNGQSKYPWQLGYWLSRPYRSCMNYGFMFYTVDYSDGSRPIRDYNDWERMDLTYFEQSW